VKVEIPGTYSPAAFRESGHGHAKEPGFMITEEADKMQHHVSRSAWDGQVGVGRDIL
jgi:hypothetical protein